MARTKKVLQIFPCKKKQVLKSAASKAYSHNGGVAHRTVGRALSHQAHLALLTARHRHDGANTKKKVM